ncbi:MAG: peptide chain release factor N(5)-glutamine methyltransferase [Rubellimicrobium sp.]|nr:peptide chain release factor N(5)-glutamine methyltransferase [Rubellimicrobium sp.]
MTTPPGAARDAATALREAVSALRAAGVEDPAGDARRLMEFAAGVPRGQLGLAMPDRIGPEALGRFDALIARRAAREPVSHLTGRRAFYGRDFHVTADVLDPRPETEILVETALSEPFSQVLDLGTGTGCILVTLLAEMPSAHGLGLDLSPEALAVATHNAAMLGVLARARFAVSDWAAKAMGPYDLIVSNPPYIAADEMAGLSPEVRDWEPRMALTDGDDGLSAYRAILSAVRPLLAPNGRLLLEMGPRQRAAVAALGVAAGLLPGPVVADLDGRDRVMCFRRA